MRSRKTDDDMSYGSFMDDPRLRDAYLSKTPSERREMAKHFHHMNMIGGTSSAKARKKMYDDYFEMERGAEIFEGCGGCLTAIIVVIGVIYAWIKG